MPNRLNIPPELNALIEKRENEERRQADASAAAAAADDTPASEPAELPAETERRSGLQRRRNQ